MKWDDITLFLLALFGCVMLLLAQVSEVLSKLPQIIRAWRAVRHELNRGSESGGRHPESGSTDPEMPGRGPG
ncbi:hypothetical protein [Streptomyces sp. NPDC001903]|uniref:hypothetical protein n=1 Tax=Streptomyces sp. NPDC001903 TaxID=3364622 RepID=UPI0036A27C36